MPPVLVESGTSGLSDILFSCTRGAEGFAPRVAAVSPQYILITEDGMRAKSFNGLDATGRTKITVQYMDGVLEQMGLVGVLPGAL